jgi:RNAse (barnase) inhibitor barstar
MSMANSSLENELDLAQTSTSDELHELLAARLGFPNSYGRNWDAFWDCIRDPEQSRMPATLYIRGWPALAQILPRDATKLRSLLSELADERHDCHVVWE